MSPDKVSPPQADPLDAALDRPDPTAWRYDKAGDTIYGTLLRLEERSTQYGPSKVVILANDEGEWAVYLFELESLHRQLQQLRPQAGERVAFRYLGEQPVKNPKPGRKVTFHAFKVAVDRPEPSPLGPLDWGSVGTGRPTSAAEDDPADGDEDIPF